MAFATAAAVPAVEELSDMVVELIRQKQVLDRKETQSMASCVKQRKSILSKLDRQTVLSLALTGEVSHRHG